MFAKVQPWRSSCSYNRGWIQKTLLFLTSYNFKVNFNSSACVRVVLVLIAWLGVYSALNRVMFVCVCFDWQASHVITLICDSCCPSSALPRFYIVAQIWYSGFKLTRWQQAVNITQKITNVDKQAFIHLCSHIHPRRHWIYYLEKKKMVSVF